MDSRSIRVRRRIRTKFLALLIQGEVARREQKKFTLRQRRATFRSTKTLDQFDFECLPKLNRALVHDLATGRYLSELLPCSSSVRSASARAISPRRSVTRWINI